MRIYNVIQLLEKEFNKNGDFLFAQNQKLYMRNQFDFYGLTAKRRREIQNICIKDHLLSLTNNFEKIIKILWTKKEREYQYCAQELILINAKDFQIKDIKLFEFMIINKPWWDTIDFIAPKILGAYFKLYPEEVKEKIDQWIGSKNIWLQRSCIIFQLKYKQQTNTQLLRYIITSLSESKEFFINKAIGWMLREYSKTNAKWVVDFINTTKLHSLSIREGLKFIKQKN